ncbi:hypothetical protein DOY81_003423 [Sarcophaga bullata]|nr:hypothetical protein DOY81_003423 [Sarcophaga bullata]
MSVSMSLVQGGAAGGAPQGAILAAAAPYYQPPAVPQDVQPDRPIGYGAFGVVWLNVQSPNLLNSQRLNAASLSSLKIYCRPD